MTKAANFTGIVGALWTLAKAAIGLRYVSPGGGRPDCIDVVGPNGTTLAALRAALPDGVDATAVATVGYVAGLAAPTLLVVWNHATDVKNSGTAFSAASWDAPPITGMFVPSIQNPAANTDSWQHTITLDAGTYALECQCDNGSNRAIVTWDCDGTPIGTMDMYAPVTFNGVVIPGGVGWMGPGATFTVTAGSHVIRGRILTRNAANTTGWFALIGAIRVMKITP